jgi:hypothetical protein
LVGPSGIVPSQLEHFFALLPEMQFRPSPAAASAWATVASSTFQLILYFFPV